MATAIDLEGLERLMAAGAQVAEALPAEDYDEAHIPGAISLPLRTLTPETAAALDPGRPVVVYCWDSL